MTRTSTATDNSNWGLLNAPASWHAVDVISDLHLHASEPATAALFQRYLQVAPFDALFILGDLFEVWVGDDVLDTDDQEPDHVFTRGICQALRACALRHPVYVMHGNRDFLLGSGFAKHTHTTLLSDPTVLEWGEQRWLMTHGDAWCLEDHDYMRFREQVRTDAWQQAFLARPLADRENTGRQLRQQSEARKELSRQDSQITYADVDPATALAWLDRSQAQTLVHGHTHRPAEHGLGDGRKRLVLSDWDAQARTPRAEALRLHKDGHWQRVPLAA